MNHHLMALGRVRHYPYPVAAHEGASAQFLMEGHDFLQVCMPGISRTEAIQIRKGKLKAGLIHDGPLILWLFQFGDNLIFECLFDARLIAPARRNLPHVTNDRQRFGFDIHLVDTTIERATEDRCVIEMEMRASLAEAIAVLAKLSSVEAMKAFSDDDEEAFRMAWALKEVGSVLEEMGIKP